MQSYLHLNVQNDNLSLLLQILNHKLASSVSVTTELSMLNEALLRNQVLKLLHGNEVVIDLVGLSWTWTTGGVGDRGLEGIWVGILEHMVKRALSDARWPGNDYRTAVLWKSGLRMH